MGGEARCSAGNKVLDGDKKPCSTTYACCDRTPSNINLPRPQAYEAQVRRTRQLGSCRTAQLMSDVPTCTALPRSDSSVISAIAKKFAARASRPTARRCCGRSCTPFGRLKGAPDLLKAREVARHIGTVTRKSTIPFRRDSMHPRRHLLHRDLRRHTAVPYPITCWPVIKSMASRWC